MKLYALIPVVVTAAVLFTTAAYGGNPPGTGDSAPMVPDSVIFKSLKARSIGPAVMSGRISSLALDPGDPFTFYAGLGTGGVMKTSDNGATFSAIFEREAVAAVGAVAVSPSNPKYVWVGTGEANDRNSSSWGNGVYRSSDAGGSWTSMGLKDTKTIARIVIHPKDSNTVYVAAMGDLWNRTPDRGLYKTTDGGKTWKCILQGPSRFRDKLGCGDVVIDTSNPSILYAALYARQRSPWAFNYGPRYTDGEDAGGIFKTTDAGEHWTRLTNGLPAQTGRIGLDIYKKNPAVVYAIIQSDSGGRSDIDNVRSKTGGVFRTTDRGEHWTRMSPLNPRPFYFSQIRVDPTDQKRVYVLGYLTHVSDDSGRTFQENLFDKVHSDCHDLVVDPKNPGHIILGTDGGIYQSFHGGKGWQYLNSFAAGEFYRISTDNSTPYRVAGGLQDNSNWVGPSNTRSREGIQNSNWLNIGGGDGFYCVFDPTDSNIVYGESQGGAVHRFNMRTGDWKGLRPEQTEGSPGYRFHWTSPLIGSVHEPGTLYLAGNHVFKLTNHGEQSTVISPDLSAHAPDRILTVGSGAENYAVVYALCESPLKAGTLWAGSDDGKLWLTTNDGGSWTDLSSRLPEKARNQWISRIEAGHHNSGVAYVAVDAHRSGNYSPLVYRTDDAGKSWTSVAGNLPADGPVKVIREDLSNPDLLFAGTEFGLFVSTNRGAAWIKAGGLPTVAVDDITVQPRERDLVIATHGRSLFILDNITPLELFVDSIRSKPAYLFPVRPASGYNPTFGIGDWGGNAIYRGENPPTGAIFNFFVRSYTGDGIAISITNDAGQTVANLNAPGTPGFNRLTWDLRWGHEFVNDYGGEGQRFVRSGEYTATMTFGKTSNVQKFRVTIEPGIETK